MSSPVSLPTMAGDSVLSVLHHSGIIDTGGAGMSRSADISSCSVLASPRGSLLFLDPARRASHW